MISRTGPKDRDERKRNGWVRNEESFGIRRGVNIKGKAVSSPKKRKISHRLAASAPDEDQSGELVKASRIMPRDKGLCQWKGSLGD
jgi:hypothetical protein